MIGVDDFKKVILIHKNFLDYCDKAEEFLNADIYDTPIGDTEGKLFDIILDQWFTKEGIDIINWWLYERVSPISGEILEFKINDKEVPMDTIIDLWNVVKDYLQ